jgi:hypothetical protein
MSRSRINQYPGCCIEPGGSHLARLLTGGHSLPVRLGHVIRSRMIGSRLVFVAEIEAEVRGFPGADDLERNFCACSVLVKKGINWLQ